MLSLTNVPLPSWGQLGSIFRYLFVNTNSIASPWLLNKERQYWMSRTAWSLYAIVLFRKYVYGKEKIHIWFPDFYCNASLAPLRELGVELSFYPLLDTCHADMVSCENMLRDSTPDILVFAHYFGEPFSANEFKLFSCKNKVWLIEDCAHCLKPENTVGNFGDFVLYSPHKYLPIPDGALMLFRENGPSKIIAANFDEFYWSLIENKKSANLSSMIWFGKRVLQKLGIRSAPRNSDFFKNEIQMSSEWLPNMKMSLLSRKILYGLLPSFDKESENRNKNALCWQSNLNKNNYINNTIEVLLGNFTPYLIGFRAESEMDTKYIYDNLRNINIPVTSWPDLPPEVLNNESLHKVSIAMRNKRFYLPIHASINTGNIEEALRCIK